MTFGEHTAVLRKQLKMPKDELVKKVGTSAPIMGSYEHNEIKPSIGMVEKMVDQPGVSVDYLMELLK